MRVFALIVLLVVLASCVGIVVAPRVYRGIDRALAWRRVRRTWKARRDELRNSVTRRKR